jgi:hypothetical protein
MLVDMEVSANSRVGHDICDSYRRIWFGKDNSMQSQLSCYHYPDHPTQFDDGLLTASEVAQLKLNAGWVVLSACNTASADRPGRDAVRLGASYLLFGCRLLFPDL